MSRLIIIVVLLINIYSCREDCNNIFYLKKDYLYENQKIKIVINGKLYYAHKMNTIYIPGIERSNKYADDICLDSINNSNMKIKFSINGNDTIFIVDTKKIAGCYLGADRDDNLTVIVDSIGVGLFWGDVRVGFE